MAKLTDLGFRKSTIAETIVSTFNEDGSPNAAPMGATLKDDQSLTIDFYNSSTTLNNMKARMCAVINLTGNIEVYYRAAFKEANPNGVLPKDWFVKAGSVNAPKLDLAEATIELSVKGLTSVNSEKTRAIFAVEQLQAEKRYPQVYCRAFGLTLEAIVHATRVKVLAGDPTERENVSELIRKIRDCDVMVDRIAPSSMYSVVMADLMKKVNVWAQK
ncbi:MAG: DUF447 domain-containing protein [Candidatus Bathyarchaeia archaeon]